MATAEAAIEAKRAAGHTKAARYDAAAKRLIVSILGGVELTIPVRLVEELAGADPADLTEIEISPAGVGLHWPRIDTDVYVPELLAGVFGPQKWMAAQFGAQDGRTRVRTG